MVGVEEWLMFVVLGVTLATLASFALGTRANVHTGERVAKWMQDGLPIISDKTTMTWIGSAALLFKMAKAKGPYRSAEIVLSFEPRDLVLRWLWARWHGRRDVMIFRGTLTEAPHFELEIFDPQGWMNRDAMERVQQKSWTQVNLPDSNLRAYGVGTLDPAFVRALMTCATQAGGRLTRLSLRRNLPNVEIHWLLPNPKTVSARAWFRDVREIGQQALKADVS
jgi:hypothetical protein